jgi:putative transposase
MPNGLARIQHLGHLHFLTFSCHRRTARLASESDRDTFCKILDETRVRREFRVTGYVVMPEHVHLLVSEPAQGTLAVAMQMLKQTVSLRLGAKGEPFWMTRYYDFNVYSEEKVRGKIDYMHFNPVKRGLTYEEMDWRWSCARFYAGLGMGPVVIEPSVMLVVPGSGVS